MRENEGKEAVKQRTQEKNGECVEEREDTENFTRRTNNWRMKRRQGANRRSVNRKITETRRKKNGKGKERKRINFKNIINSS